MNKDEEPDPLIDEIHEIRRRIFAEHGNDLHRYFKHLKELERQFAGQLISTPPPPGLRRRLRELKEQADEATPPSPLKKSRSAA